MTDAELIEAARECWCNVVRQYTRCPPAVVDALLELLAANEAASYCMICCDTETGHADECQVSVALAAIRGALVK